MPQPLIIDHSKVNVGGKFLTCDARVHWFVAIVVISSRTKLLAEVIYSSVRLRKPINMLGRETKDHELHEREWGGILC
jgi:hypothetical protein